MWRVLGVLAVSRALGDRHLKPFVTAEPEVVEVERHADDLAIVMATDGVWDVLSNNEVAACVAASPSAQEAANQVVDMAYARGSADNITVIVITLTGRGD